MNELKGWLSAREAAGRLNIHQNNVLLAVRRGRLAGQKIGGRVLIHEDALKSYRPRRRKQ